MTNPYADLPPDRYWRTGVADAHPLEPRDLYHKKFAISPEDAIATAGSCFAQHIAAHLKRRRFHVLDVERPPPAMDPVQARRYGYLTYSARYGNVYHVRQFVQLIKEARANEPDPSVVWEKDGRYFDAMRPSVEPQGLDSAEEVSAHRGLHLQKVRRLLNQLDLLIFTLGLTEAWVDRQTGRVYPTCPGVIAGEYDDERYEFHNFSYDEVRADLEELRRLVQRRRPEARMLLTVSPVPLTATASGRHVLTATTYSKSVLRAAAGHLADSHPDVDYFPSYEIVSSPWSRGMLFESNLRSVSDVGVNTVMGVFFAAHGASAEEAGAAAAKRRPEPSVREDEEAQCEDELLDAFRPA